MRQERRTAAAVLILGLITSACQSSPPVAPFASPASSILASVADHAGLPSLVAMSDGDSELGVQATVFHYGACTFGILTWKKMRLGTKRFLLPMVAGVSVPQLFDKGATVEVSSGRQSGPLGDDYVYGDSGFMTKRDGRVTMVGHVRTLRTGNRMCLLFAGGPPTLIDDARCVEWLDAIRSGPGVPDAAAKDLVASLCTTR